MFKWIHIFSCCLSIVYAGRIIPEQIAIAATGIAETPIVVTWVTFSPTTTSQVQYWVRGDNTTNRTAVGTTTRFVNDGSTKIVRYIHRTWIAATAPAQLYDYRCGSPTEGWSEIKTLKTLSTDEAFSPTFAVYGDFGLQNARSLPYLKREVLEGKIDGVLHCGDIAYDLHENDGNSGDSFMNLIEPIASAIPYMVAPGNHEFIDNFTHYRKRFTMPGDKESLYYSWDVGPAHIISINTEFYFFLWDGLRLIDEQFHWLEENLKRANEPTQRAKRPWIITMYHQPMYCTTVNNEDCNHHESVVRVGLPFGHKYGLEKLFYDYGVDIALSGHEHIYERYWPIYNFQVKNGSYEEPYTEPGAPVHIVSGAAGCREEHKGDGFEYDQPDWVSFTSSNYSYTKMTIHNFTHVTFRQISVDLGGAVIDEFTVVKHKHGPYH